MIDPGFCMAARCRSHVLWRQPTAVAIRVSLFGVDGVEGVGVNFQDYTRKVFAYLGPDICSPSVSRFRTIVPREPMPMENCVLGAIDLGFSIPVGDHPTT